MKYTYKIILALMIGGLATIEAKSQQQADYESAEKYKEFDLGGKLSRNSLSIYHGKLMIQITSGLIFRRQRESSFIMLRHIMENENCCSTIMKWQWRWPSSHEKRLMPPISLSKSSSFLRIRNVYV